MCPGPSFPKIACSARVLANEEIAPAVYKLTISRQSAIPAPLSGQFFMLRARPSGVLLGRPISVYRADEASITFLILKKGAGTAELCALRNGDELDLVGPIGNCFVTPPEMPAFEGRPMPRVAIVGGGIGVAPVAGFALGLVPGSFDFYASFRSRPYGLDGLESRAGLLVVTTEDGSAGVKGMLPAVFEAGRYDLVYACGPTPMLKYVQSACAAAASKPLAFLSLEQRMACGAGACLGCTVRTVSGNRRCCVDGPVFNAAEVIL